MTPLMGRALQRAPGSVLSIMGRFVQCAPSHMVSIMGRDAQRVTERISSLGFVWVTTYAYWVSVVSAFVRFPQIPTNLSKQNCDACYSGKCRHPTSRTSQGYRPHYDAELVSQYRTGLF